MVVELLMNYPRTGFTLIEVMACVLVITLGLSSAIGLVIFGQRLVRKSHGQTIGMATAMTVTVDPSPLKTDPSLSPNAPTSSGYLNGLWVVRTESDETPISGTGGKMVAVTVRVDVYEIDGGDCFASTTRRLIRQKP
jgi:prepilin-type N-terminal cleavage/methylation domain-containing protein